MITPVDDPKALSYISQIKETFAELGRANANKLECAIKLGGLLKGAKEALGKKGNWMEFRAAHFREISHSTANVYMQLAENKDLLDDPSNSQHAVNSMVEDLSIRGALEAMKYALKTPKERAQADVARKAAKDEKEATRLANAESAERAKAATKSADLATVLSDKAPDELLLALGPDDDKKAELFRQQLKTAKPVKVAMILKDVWKLDDVQLLVSALTRLLATTPTETQDLTIPKQLERRPAQATA
jgi:hypothetical protein